MIDQGFRLPCKAKRMKRPRLPKILDCEMMGSGR